MAPSSRKRLFLVDAMGYIFRAYHAPMDRLQTRDGTPTKVPYLFATMMRRLLESKTLNPDYLAIVYDVLAPTFRDKLFTQYKAQRPPMPDDLAVQLPFVRRYCEAMRFPIVELAGYEADDLIGTLARQASAVNLETFIVTADKDLMQLVGGPVRILNPSKGDLIIDEKKVEELMGVPPQKVADVMALMGDTIDNIPGARDPNEKPAPGERRKAGIGEVGARMLIQQFGSAEEAIRRASEVKRASYREALEKYGEFVRLSKQLAQIPTDAPVQLDLNAFTLQQPEVGALRELFAELGFTSLLKNLPAATLSEKTDYASFASARELREFLSSVLREQEVAIWLDVDAADEDEECYGCTVRSIEVSNRSGFARTLVNDSKNETLSALAEFFTDVTRPKIVHDPKTFALFANPADSSTAQLPLTALRHATKLYSYLLRPTTANHSFAEVVLRHLNVTLSGAPGEHADFLTRLAPLMRSEVERENLTSVYERIDLPLAAVLARIERAGVCLHPTTLKKISATLEEEIAGFEKRIYELAGFEFNINSPVQLAEVLYDKLNLTLPRRTRGKSRSTAAEILAELAGLHELPKLVIEYRELAKLKFTYADVLHELISPHTGRIHTQMNQTGTATGRLSSSNPNLQNIPIRTSLGREIRAAFVAEPGNVLFSADYSQIELRILAHFSEDPVLVGAFQRGEDIHSRTAQEVFGVAPFAQTAEHRRAAKVINFGIIYGLSPFGLAQNLQIDQKEAARFIAAYFDRYRGVRKYLEQQVAETRKSGITRTLFGRVRQIPEINSPQPNLRNFAERTAMNTPLQGTAADLIKLAMIEIDRRLAHENFRSRMILQVHDELLFEGPHDELDRLAPLVKRAMEQVHSLHVPLLVDVKAGPNWRDMKPLTTVSVTDGKFD
ncbi:MAG TPA: DNA polymerase I [Candidatus Acidoferrales bacterium]|nr:DNA polymerase I [Candidatus Acidoferrales bacterium]